jgi:lipopolysaccharide/colanic/teichoic acid biosynthesis glycosyltransferase
MNDTVRRIVDVLVSATVLALASPVLLVAMVLIRLESPGHPIYRQRRSGLHGHEFDVLKLRTMVAGAEHMGAGMAVNEGDPRITRLGAFLRATAIDELPQLVNVLRGEMSLVGPRPLPLRDHAMLEDWHRARALVLPGMTGLWQISGRSGLEFDDLVRLDFAYIESWSIWSDVSIIARTIPAVLGGRGAY